MTEPIGVEQVLDFITKLLQEGHDSAHTMLLFVLVGMYQMGDQMKGITEAIDKLTQAVESFPNQTLYTRTLS